ncbi:hypothetical protein, partial [Nocardia aobensis]|uniref:hypothetical protein n=1 Tax=Nocardia aobensis TaxID=257277 RepID=UPI001C3F3474
WPGRRWVPLTVGSELSDALATGPRSAGGRWRRIGAASGRQLCERGPRLSPGALDQRCADGEFE